MNFWIETRYAFHAFPDCRPENPHLNTEVTISPFTMDVYNQVFELWEQCEGVGLSEADSEDKIRAYLKRNPYLSLTAVHEGTVVGAVLCGHDGRRGFIHHLAVHPNYRRRGIGERLVDRCLSRLRKIGVQKCHVFIFNDNAGGIEFWKCLGWTLRSDISVISKVIEGSD